MFKNKNHLRIFDPAAKNKSRTKSSAPPLIKNKKGISSIIATLLIVALTVILVAIVWTVVNNLISQKIQQTNACFGNFNLVTINSQYTCYNSSSNQLRFSLGVGDTSVDEIIVGISSPSKSISLTMNSTPSQIANLSLYNGTVMVASPGTNSGITYIYNWTGSDVPNSIQIAPVVNGQQCGSSDSLSPISNCLSLS